MGLQKRLEDRFGAIKTKVCRLLRYVHISKVANVFFVIVINLKVDFGTQGLKSEALLKRCGTRQKSYPKFKKLCRSSTKVLIEKRVNSGSHKLTNESTNAKAGKVDIKFCFVFTTICVC